MVVVHFNAGAGLAVYRFVPADSLRDDYDIKFIHVVFERRVATYTASSFSPLFIALVLVYYKIGSKSTACRNFRALRRLRKSTLPLACLCDRIVTEIWGDAVVGTPDFNRECGSKGPEKI